MLPALLRPGIVSALAADFSPHAVNTQRADDKPPAAADLVRGISLPPGFRVELFAAEPEVCQPIAITTDERGRLWAVENYSDPDWRTEGTDRVLIFDDTDGDGLIYLDDMFPAEWRGRMLMCNTHGKRVNVDRLEHGPRGIVGRHEPDFLQAFDTWFRGIELVGGPDGRVWIADWTDKGECHDHDGVHRTSGRNYTVLHGDARPPQPTDLHAATSAELVALQIHPNDWFCRQARRILTDRFAEGREMARPAAELPRGPNQP